MSKVTKNDQVTKGQQQIDTNANLGASTDSVYQDADYDVVQEIFGTKEEQQRELERRAKENRQRELEKKAYEKLIADQLKVLPTIHAAQTLEVTDFNGDYSRGTAEGEFYDTSAERLVLVLTDTPCAKVPFAEQDWTKQQYNDVVAVNYLAMHECSPGLPEPEKIKIAIMKAKLVQIGVTSPYFVPGDFHVKHNDCKFANASQMAKIATPFNGGTNNNVDATITPAKSKALVETITDLICMSNHHFKARGHHWTENSDKQYQNVLNKLQLTDLQNSALPSLIGIFSYSLHCIFPVLKERFALQAAQDGKCSGAMTKRINVCPAGGAVLPIIAQGYNDLKSIAPGLKETMKKEIAYLDECMKIYEKDRMQFSVNAIYYGKRRQVIDEQKLGALGAVVWGTLMSFSENHPLLESKALQRVANLSPITGYVVAKQVKKISTSERAIAWLSGEAQK